MPYIIVSSGKSAHDATMKAERIVLSIIAILIGLFVAGTVFFVYQITQNKNTEKKEEISILPSPTPSTTTSLLSVSSPENESVTNQKIIEIKGKGPRNATIIIATENGHHALRTSDNGDFSEEITLDSGVNILQVTALTDDGQEASIVHTISYSTESF